MIVDDKRLLELFKHHDLNKDQKLRYEVILQAHADAQGAFTRGLTLVADRVGADIFAGKIVGISVAYAKALLSVIEEGSFEERILEEVLLAKMEAVVIAYKAADGYYSLQYGIKLVERRLSAARMLASNAIVNWSPQ